MSLSAVRSVNYLSLLPYKSHDFILLLTLKAAAQLNQLPVSIAIKFNEFIFLQALKAAGQIWLLSNFDSQEDIAYPNDPRVPIKVDDDLKLLFRGIELPRDMIDIERDLQKNGMKPATNTAQRRARSEVQGMSSKPKPKKKKHEITKRTKLTNAHLPELFRNLTDNKSWC